MKERPILFSGAMVRAILDGRKTQTRRVVKLPENAREVKYWTTPTGRSQPGWADPGVNYWTPDPSGETSSNHIDPCPYGQPGDRLWVREAWRLTGAFANEKPSNYEFPDTLRDNVAYRADPYSEGVDDAWRPSIHLPRGLSRIILEITSVRVERVQEISDDDVEAEGAASIHNFDCASGYSTTHHFHPDQSCGCGGETMQQVFARLWDSINAARGYGWGVNPWVWVIEFRRI